MDLNALFECLGSMSCIVTQTSTGLIVGALLFLVAAGLTLIFGVLGVINFAHGSFYMLGAYVALSAYRITDNYALAAVAAGLGVGLFALVFERFFMRRVYKSDVLLQLSAACQPRVAHLMRAGNVWTPAKAARSLMSSGVSPVVTMW